VLVLSRKRDEIIDVPLDESGLGKFKVSDLLKLIEGKSDDDVVNLLEGAQVTLTIVEIRGDKVRVGIDAPKDVPVHRREVYDAIKRERRSETTVEDTSNTGTQSAAG
jgi:carbon storage regulator